MLKYESVVNDLIKKIDDGVYPANAQLPTLSELCDIYEVSKITITKAMDELEALGLVARRRGSGTFVKNTRSDAARHLTWTGETGIQGTKTSYSPFGEVVSHVQHFSIEQPSPLVANALGMTEGFVYHIVRTRFVGDEPLCVEYTFMPINLIPNVTVAVLEDSVYQYIEKKLGLTIDSAHSTIRATLPTTEECEWLGIVHDYPLLEIEQTAFLSDGSTFEYSITRHAKLSGTVRTVRHHQFQYEQS